MKLNPGNRKKHAGHYPFFNLRRNLFTEGAFGEGTGFAFQAKRPVAHARQIVTGDFHACQQPWQQQVKARGLEIERAGRDTQEPDIPEGELDPKNEPVMAVHPEGALGAGFRFFLTDWLATDPDVAEGFAQVTLPSSPNRCAITSRGGISTLPILNDMPRLAAANSRPVNSSWRCRAGKFRDAGVRRPGVCRAG